MKNKGFIIIIVVIGLLVGCVVWQQINIMEIQSQLLGSPGSQSTLNGLAEIELQLDSNEKAREVTQSDMLMTWTDSMYFLATQNWDQANSYLDLHGTLNNTMVSLLARHDDLMAQKIALLQGQ